MAERRLRHGEVLLTVGHSAVVLAPRHLLAVGFEVGAGDVVVDADLGAANAGEERLGAVGAGLGGRIGLLVVDALREEAVVQAIPGSGFVGIEGRAGGHLGADRGHRSRLGAEHEGQRLAAPLAHYHDDLALSGLVLGLAAINAVGLLIGGLHVAAEVGTIDLDLTGQGALVTVGRDGFADLMGEDEGRLVLAIQIAGELEGAVALGAVGEDRDGEQDVADRHLAGGEDGAARDAELMAARLALPQLASLVGVGRGAGATRAHRFALRLRPADQPEGVMRFLIRKPRNPSEAQAPCGFGEEEVLRHGERSNVFR